MIKNMLVLAISIPMVGCATMFTYIPQKDSINPVEGLSDGPNKEIGYLDMFTMGKVWASDESRTDVANVYFDFKIRENSKKSQWKPLPYLSSKFFLMKRFSLPPGNYILRAESNGAQIKDFDVAIGSKTYTLFFYKASVSQMKNPNSQGDTNVNMTVGLYGGSISIPASLEYEVYPPMNINEDVLLQTLLEKNWKRRAYAMVMLGQFGSGRSVAALSYFKDDAILGTLAKTAIDSITSKEGGQK